MTGKIIKNVFDEFLNFKYERVSDTNMMVTLPVQPLFINTTGGIHGGIICTLADVAMSNIFEPDETGRQAIVTVDLKTTFIKAAKGEYLIADAKLIKKGRTLNHVDCYIYDDKNVLVSKATGIFANQ
jgi:uncharacterized protein (TIGR00369 family)